MSKIVKCDIKGFEGQITIPDVLTLPVYLEFKRALVLANDSESDGLDIFEQMGISLPGMIQVVEKWELAGVPENVSMETWPATPPSASILLYNWLLEAIVDKYLASETSTPEDIKEKVEKRNAKAIESGNPEEVAGDPES